jgi:hypothetical protein
MKIRNYLPLILYATFASVSWFILDGQSLAQGTNCLAPAEHCTSPRLLSTGKWRLAQTTEANNASKGASVDLDNRISILPDQADKSRLTVKASITNRGEQPHYVYYIVAKLVSGETHLKQTIIPVNSTIEPGETTDVTHAISKESFSGLSIKNIKPIIIKSEYR